MGVCLVFDGADFYTRDVDDVKSDLLGGANYVLLLICIMIGVPEGRKSLVTIVWPGDVVDRWEVGGLWSCDWCAGLLGGV